MFNILDIVGGEGFEPTYTMPPACKAGALNQLS